MKIQRTINGAKINIELLPEELVEAYYEQQEKFDIEDVVSYAEMFDSDELEEYMGCDYATYLSYKEEIAKAMRKNIDSYGMDFPMAREEAVRDVLKTKTATPA